MFIVVIEYRFTTPHVLTASDEAEAREKIMVHAKQAKRATIYKHVPGVATAGMMDEFYSVTMEPVA